MRNLRKLLAVTLVGVLALGGVAFTSVAIVPQSAPPAVEEILQRGGFDVPAGDLLPDLAKFQELVNLAFSPAHLGHPDVVVSDVSHSTYTFTAVREGVTVTVTADSFDTSARAPYVGMDFALDIATWTKDGAVYREKSLDFSASTATGDIDFSMSVTTRTEGGVTVVNYESFDKSADVDQDDEYQDEDEEEEDDEDEDDEDEDDN